MEQPCLWEEDPGTSGEHANSRQCLGSSNFHLALVLTLYDHASLQMSQTEEITIIYCMVENKS